MTISRIYAGIGSRSTPQDIQDLMRDIAKKLARPPYGYVLRSGGARGADTAFEVGCDMVEGSKEIYFAKDATPEARLMLNGILTPQHIQALTRGGWLDLHARNCFQILGKSLDSPVHCVLCWTPDGAERASECTKETGGTGTAIKLADKHGRPVFNLKNPDRLSKWKDWVSQ